MFIYALVLLFSFQLHSRTHDVATSKAIIVSILYQKNPDAVPEFNHFFDKYDRSVIMFFDRKNNDSLAQHIRRMEAELQELQAVYNDERFSSVREPLIDQYEHLSNLLVVLRRYVGSRDALSLAFKVRKFKFLLPPEVRKRGNISLYRSLRHRLAMS